MFDLTTIYSHSKFMQGVKEGEKIIANTPKGNESQLYKVGDKIKMHNHGDIIATIIDSYCDNGYIGYGVEYKLTPKARKIYNRNIRQRDVITIK